jgi:hypothetical protein
VQDVLPGMDPDPAPVTAKEPAGDEGTTDPRAIIAAAITEAAKHRRGDLVHIAAVRRYLTQDVPKSELGATFNRLRSRGVLVFTNRYEANGDTSPKARNANKASPVWRLERPITPEDYQR